MMAERCERHRAPAGWRCTTCGGALCPDCAALRTHALNELPVCTRCGGTARALTRHRRDRASFAARLPSAVLWLVKPRGLLALAATVLACVIAGFVGRLVPFFGPLLGMLLAIGGAAAALFTVVRATAQGHDEVELTDFSVGDVLLPALFRLALATAPVWGLAVAYDWLGSEDAPPALLMLGWGLLAAAYLPAAFIMAATESPILDLLNPLKVLGIAAQLGRPFLWLVAVWWGALLVSALAAGVTAVLHMPQIPFITSGIELVILLVGPLLGARAAGLLLYVEGDRVDYDSPERFIEPLLGETSPRGVAPALAEGGEVRSRARSRHREPLELEEPTREPSGAGAGAGAEAEAATRRVAEFTAEDLPPFHSGLSRIAAAGPSRPEVSVQTDAAASLTGQAPLTSLEAQQVAALRASMRAADYGGTVELWRAAQPEGLGVEELLWIAKAASHLRHDGEAYGVLARAVETPAPDALRAQAAVIFGRFLFERLQRPEEAVSWMERAALRYPQTPGGRFAAGWLAEHDTESAARTGGRGGAAPR